MFDKKLENNSKKSAEHYNQEAAQVLNDWLTCAWKKEEPHLKQFDWVVVLNPNPHETKQNMSFRDAYQKESWFFDNLFAPMGTHWSADGTPTAKPQPQLQPGPEPSSHQPLPEPEPEPSSHQPQTEPESQAGDETPRTLAVINPRRLCGIDGFRSALIKKYADFATAACLKMAPQIFQMVIAEQQKLLDQWGWTPEEEHYEDKQRLIGVLAESVKVLLNEGKELNPRNVLEHFKRHFDQVMRASRPGGVVQNAEQTIVALLADLTGRCDKSAHKNKFRRFPELVKNIGETCRVLCRLCKDDLKQQLDMTVAAATELMSSNKAGRETAVPHVVFSAQQNLVQLAHWIEALPKIPVRILSANTEPQLAHAKKVLQVHLKDEKGKFGLQLKGGMIMAHSPRPGDLPIGATIIECMGKPMPVDTGGVVKAIAEAAKDIGPGQPVFFTYVKSPSMLDETDLSIADWLMPDRLDQQYRAKRDELMKHRRAAELLRLVFDEDTHGMSEREQYDKSPANQRPLVRLGPYKQFTQAPAQGPDEGIPGEGFLGKQLATPTQADAQQAKLTVQFGTDAEPVANNMKKLPGFCSTPGCFRPADAACEPCGHAVCCWDCINELYINGGEYVGPKDGEPGRHISGCDGCCPVCDVKITRTFLCYELHEEGEDDCE